MPDTPTMSIEEATQAITAPGQMFEMEDVEIRGIPTRVWKNCPANLRVVLELSGATATRTTSSTRTSAPPTRSTSASPPPSPASCAAASASSSATAWPSPCAISPSGPWPSGARPWPVAWWCRSTRGGRAPSSTTGWPTRGPRSPSSTRPASTAWRRTSPSCPTFGPWWSPTRTAPRYPPCPVRPFPSSPSRSWSANRRPTSPCPTSPSSPRTTPPSSTRRARRGGPRVRWARTATCAPT